MATRGETPGLGFGWPPGVRLWDLGLVATRGETRGLKEEVILFRSHFESEIRSLVWVRLRKHLLGANDPEYSASTLTD